MTGKNIGGLIALVVVIYLMIFFRFWAGGQRPVRKILVPMAEATLFAAFLADMAALVFWLRAGR
jgi:hypothetical protein